jgi:Family of unknown function (DUF5752)
MTTTEIARATEPFQFATASYLVLIGNHTSLNLSELSAALGNCSDASIFYHTFQSLGRHHFLTEGFSNDFAQWVLNSCNRPSLAEQLASVDVRDYVSLVELRTDLRRTVDEFCKENPNVGSQSAFEKFYFCETIEEEVPLGLEAWTLEEFHDRLKDLPHGALEFHFITSRLRLQLRSNDFSQWITKELGLKDLARKIDQIDIYTNTLDSARAAIMQLVEKELKQ